MASEDHKSLAQFVKDVHLSLRQSTAALGREEAWNQHLNQTDVLEKYSKCMEKLATEYWDPNIQDESKTPLSRIKWAADFCYDYFINGSYLSFRDKEKIICSKICIKMNTTVEFNSPVKHLDVGSCYNPFKEYSFLDVLAVDLFPANKNVLSCDFLKVEIGDSTTITDTQVTSLKQLSFEVITFCFLLEYLPLPEMRLLACENAYELLKPEGLLIINTPDSKHVGANCKIMKCWRYTLACIGFSRIKYEKYAHMHCMAFRKALNKETSVRWAELHKEPYFDFTMPIPQDISRTADVIDDNRDHTVTLSREDFFDLPFCENMDDDERP